MCLIPANAGNKQHFNHFPIIIKMISKALDDFSISHFHVNVNESLFIEYIYYMY